MTSKRLHLLLSATICLLLVALVAGAYGTNKLLASHAAHLTSLKAKNQSLGLEQNNLLMAKADIKKYSDLQKITNSIVPEDKDQAEAVREIVSIANSNGVSLASISFPASTLGTTPTGTASSSTATSSPAAAANSKLSALSQLQAVKNIPGVYSLVISIQSDSTQPVAYNKFISFLNGLEHNRRTAQVSTISLTPSTNNHSLLSFALTLNEYIKP